MRPITQPLDIWLERTWGRAHKVQAGLKSSVSKSVPVTCIGHMDACEGPTVLGSPGCIELE